MELICGACHGRLLAEVPGTTVACPHCGTHLQTPAAPLPPAIQPLSLDLEDDPAHATDAEGDTVHIDPIGQLPDALLNRVAAEAFPNAVSPEVSSEPVAAHTTPLHEPVSSSEAETVAEIPPGVFSGEKTGSVPTGGNGGLSHDESNSDVAARHESGDAHAAIAEESPAQVAAGPAALETQPQSDIPPSAAGPAAEPAFSGFEAQLAPVEMDLSGRGTALEMESGSTSEGVEIRNLADDRGSVRAAGPAARKGVSPIAFLLVASYASAMTLACLFLAYMLKNNPRTLDLPDLAPPVSKDKKKVTSMIYLPPDKEIPAANILRLGETRQFGSLKVTPQRVTRGPLEFRFYNNDADEKKDPEGPVLKLHLRFENVSEDQEFVPLDGRLVFTKEADRKSYGSYKANNFVCLAANRVNSAGRIYVFDQTPGGMWLIKDQHLDEELGPGQVLESFIPTVAEEIEALEGDLVWRVHFRKGYNRTSYRGVTTLIEVLFNSSQIVDDEPRAADEPVEEPAAAESTDRDA